MFRLQPAKIWNTTRYIYKNYGTWGILFHSKTQTKMKIIINAVLDDDQGIERVFRGEYEGLHMIDWDSEVQKLIDSVHEYEKTT